MSAIKSYLTEHYINWKTRRNRKALNNQSMNFPLSSSEIRNVLIILPRETNYLDPAVAAIQKIRQHYDSWHYMVLDVDKILPQKLNKLGLPNEEFLKELEKKKFDLVLDLNFGSDHKIRYLILMLKIRFRIHLLSTADDLYNIIVQTNRESLQNFGFILNNLKTIIVK